MKNFLSILLTIFIGLSNASCSNQQVIEQQSETDQAGLACAVLAPFPPAGAACFVGVTGAQIIATVLIGGVAVGSTAVIINQIKTYKGVKIKVTGKSGTAAFTASCHLARAVANATWCDNKFVNGTGNTCAAAQSNANSKVPRGCYKRHCQC